MLELDVNEAAVKDIREVQKDIERKMKELTGGPMVMTMRNATMMLQRDAKILAPVDTGRLRASITPSVTSTADSIKGIVGSNIKYAAAVEMGSRPHWPPIEPIIEWVHRKKMAGTYSIKTKGRTGSKKSQRSQDYIVAKWVAKAIAMRGTPAKKFLQKSYEKNIPRIVAMIERAVKQITES